MKIRRILDWDAPRSTWPAPKEPLTKPIVDPRTGKKVVAVDPDSGAEVIPQIVPPMVGIELLSAPPKQKFDEKKIKDYIAAGWLKKTETHFIIVHSEGETHYRIVRKPGRYSCFTGEKLPDDDFLPGGGINPGPTGALARAHIAKHHAGEESPDPENPSGYYCTRSYKCVRED